MLRFLQLAPYLVLSLIFGVWVDRVRRRPVMLAANLTRMVLLALIPVLYRLHALSMAPLLVIACAIGVASVLFDVSWMSYVPTLVRDPEHYVEASAKMGISSSAADVAGPGLAGVLVSALTAPVALIVDAFSYLVSVISLLLIRRTHEPAPQPAATKRRLPTELRDGLRWVFGNPVLRALALIGFCCNFSMITVWTMFLLYGTHDLHLSSTTLGGIFATASVGGLIGATISRKIIGRFPLGRVYLVAQSALLLGPAVIALAGRPEAGDGRDVHRVLLHQLPGPRRRQRHHRQPAPDQHPAVDDGPDDRGVPHAAVRWRRARWSVRRRPLRPHRRHGRAHRGGDRIGRRGDRGRRLAGQPAPSAPAANKRTGTSNPLLVLARPLEAASQTQPDHFMTHIAMWGAAEHPETEWGNLVTDDEYRATPAR